MVLHRAHDEVFRTWSHVAVLWTLEVGIAYSYWTVVGAVAVPAAIAYADAMAIKLSGQKSVSERHENAIAVLDESVAETEATSEALA